MEYIHVSEIHKELTDDIGLADKMPGSWYRAREETRPRIGGVIPIVPHDKILSFRNQEFCLFYIHREKGFPFICGRKISFIELDEARFTGRFQKYVSSLEFHGITRESDGSLDVVFLVF